MSFRRSFLHRLAQLGLGVFLCLPCVSWGFDFGDLREILQEHQIRNSVELARALPDVYKQKRVLGYRSGQMLQVATWTSPRAITYGEDARLLMAWTDSRPGREDFVEVRALDRNDKPVFGKIIYDNNEQRMTFHEETSCKACHSERLHANWHSYNFWPGFYGSRHFRMNRGEMSPELLHFQEFLSQSAERGIYAELGGKITIADLEKNNSELTDLIQRENAMSVAKELLDVVQRNPQYRAAVEIAMSRDNLSSSSVLLRALPGHPTPQALEKLLQEKAVETARAIDSISIKKKQLESEYLNRPPFDDQIFDKFDQVYYYFMHPEKLNQCNSRLMRVGSF